MGREHCPLYLKCRVRAAISRNRQALHQALVELLDIRADSVVVIDAILGEIPELIGRRKLTLCDPLADENQQQGGGTAAGLDIGDGLEFGHDSSSERAQALTYMAKYFAKMAASVGEGLGHGGR